MNAIQKNQYTEAWAALAKTLPRPKGIVAISAHWYIPGGFVTRGKKYETIHDFGGFPEELYKFEYPAPGDPELAALVQNALIPSLVSHDYERGLDHGTWSVLCHLFPKADVPVVQLSLDECQPPFAHYEMGRRLARLRDQGILILGSGNLIHNLHAYSWGRHDSKPYDWAVRFEQTARKLMVERDHQSLIEYESLGKDAQLSVPTPEHYLPLLYVLATQGKDEQAAFPVEGIDGGAVSMLAVKIGV